MKDDAWVCRGLPDMHDELARKIAESEQRNVDVWRRLIQIEPRKDPPGDTWTAWGEA